MRHSHLACLATAALALAGSTACHKSSAKAEAAAAASAASDHHAASVQKLDELATNDPAAADSMKTIAGRLEYEAGHRPSGTIKAEAVFAALGKAGLPITDGPRQYVGVVAGADYCVGGQTADGLGVAVCEYDSPAKAEAGKAAVEKKFAALDSVRTIVVRGATTLTLTARPDAPLADSKHTATEAFNTL
ncbi:MAG TPA: hypothetical protein VHE35_15570 [Kofleriaceae bacterium]|nr:hypothetical protein [Kofleriaceae bacterium]